MPKIYLEEREPEINYRLVEEEKIQEYPDEYLKGAIPDLQDELKKTTLVKNGFIIGYISDSDVDKYRIKGAILEDTLHSARAEIKTIQEEIERRRGSDQ